MQANYCLGVSLRNQIRYEDSCAHLEKALSAAHEVQDSIKDQIWRELAACKHLLWQQEVSMRERQRERMKLRLKAYMDCYFKAHPDVRSLPSRAPSLENSADGEVSASTYSMAISAWTITLRADTSLSRAFPATTAQLTCTAG
jgi:hypothetical protein